MMPHLGKYFWVKYLQCHRCNEELKKKPFRSFLFCFLVYFYIDNSVLKIEWRLYTHIQTTIL